jgi:succinate dehydrogenase / fumarate reductase cytochrome b subunit
VSRPAIPRCSRASSRRTPKGSGTLRRVAYYKGCLASLSAKELDTSTQALAPKVGLELVELETVTCCGAGDIHEAEPDYYLHLNARILAYAEAANCDTLLTVCNVCTLNLRQANWQLKHDSDLRERVSTNLERVGVPPYSGNVEVRHLLWEIAEGEGYELLKQSAHRGLKGLKIAPFYGCQILRPSKILGFEDPDRPWSLERIIEACGGEAIDYPAKIKCCGFPIIQAREETALGELIQPIEQAKEAGADALVTPCPLCHLSLDAWQSKLKEATGKDLAMPVLHLSQLVGVAAGLEESELKFKRHVVSMTPVLEKLEV